MVKRSIFLSRRRRRLLRSGLSSTVCLRRRRSALHIAQGLLGRLQAHTAWRGSPNHARRPRATRSFLAFFVPCSASYLTSRFLLLELGDLFVAICQRRDWQSRTPPDPCKRWYLRLAGRRRSAVGNHDVHGCSNSEARPPASDSR